MLKFASPSLALVALLSWASPALAADSTVSNASDEVKSKPFSLKDNFTMDVTFYYSGSSVTGLGSPYQPTADGYDDLSSPNFLQTRFRPAYKIAKDFTIGPVFEWNYFPVFGGDYNFGNIFFRLAKDNVVKTAEAYLFVDFRFYTPTTEKSQKQDMIVSGRLYQDGNYTFKGTQFGFGSEDYIRGWAYGNNSPNGSRMVEFWWAPYVYYNLSSKFTVRFQVDGNFYSQTGDSDVHTEPTHLRAGFYWSPIPEIYLAPHLYVPVSTVFAWSAAAVNLEAWALVF